MLYFVRGPHGGLTNSVIPVIGNDRKMYIWVIRANYALHDFSKNWFWLPGGPLIKCSTPCARINSSIQKLVLAPCVPKATQTLVNNNHALPTLDNKQDNFWCVLTISTKRFWSNFRDLCWIEIFLIIFSLLTLLCMDSKMSGYWQGGMGGIDMLPSECIKVSYFWTKSEKKSFWL